MNGTRCPEENLYSLKMWIETDQKLMFRHYQERENGTPLSL
jgi:hypothetical protein